MKAKKRGVRPPRKNWSRKRATKLCRGTATHRDQGLDVSVPRLRGTTRLSFDTLADAFGGWERKRVPPKLPMITFADEPKATVTEVLAGGAITVVDIDVRG